MDAVLFGNRAGHGRGDQTAHRARRGRHASGFLSRLDDVVQQKDTHLVARDGDILAVRVAHHGADAVRVGVSPDDQVTVEVFAASGVRVATYTATYAEVRAAFFRLSLKRGVYVLRIHNDEGAGGAITVSK